MNPSPDTHLDATQGLDAVARYLVGLGWGNNYTSVWDKVADIRQAINGKVKPGQNFKREGKEDEE